MLKDLDGDELRDKPAVAKLGYICDRVRKNFGNIDPKDFNLAFWMLLGSLYAISNAVESDYIRPEIFTQFVRKQLESLKKTVESSATENSDRQTTSMLLDFSAEFKKMFEKRESVTDTRKDDVIFYNNEKVPLKLSFYEDFTMLASGDESPCFYNLDMLSCNTEFAGRISTLYSSKIKEIKKGITKLCFIDKDFGPIGALGLLSNIVQKTGIDAVIYRPSRFNADSRIQGEKLNPSDKVCIVYDLIVLGRGVKDAVEFLGDKFGVEVPYAIVLYNYHSGENHITISTKYGETQAFSLLTYPEQHDETITKP